MDQKILSLDLSTKSSGWCVGHRQHIQDHGCTTAASRDVIKRIIKMREQIIQIIKKYKIKKIIMQQVRPQVNSHTNKVLMWLQAIVVVSAYEIDSNIQYEFIGASSWRAKLNMKQGRGVKREYLKNKDIQYVKDKYGITVNDDQADAMCIFEAYWIDKEQTEINWE